MKPKKSWREKLADAKGLPRIIPIPESLRRWGSGSMVIPAPMEVDAIMRKVPRGKVITMNEIRSLLARKHGATIACPITTGIFAWIAAHAAEEGRKAGRKRVTPYWRSLKTGGMLNEKYPGGIEEQREKLESEGHRIVKKGKKYIVEDSRRGFVQAVNERPGKCSQMKHIQ
jgi:alkylated DNA nucleotide flippase Atl1